MVKNYCYKDPYLNHLYYLGCVVVRLNAEKWSVWVESKGKWSFWVESKGIIGNSKG